MKNEKLSSFIFSTFVGMTKFSEFPYVADRFNAVRRETVQVRVGEALIGVSL